MKSGPLTEIRHCCDASPDDVAAFIAARKAS